MKIRKLNQSGVGHLAVIVIAAVAVVAVAGVLVFKAQGSQKPLADAAGASTCGSGYVSVASKTLASSSGATSGGGTLYVYKNGSKYCALTIAGSASYGKSKTMSATLGWVSSSTPTSVDKGTYKYYAGPIYMTVGCAQYASGQIVYGGVTYNAKWYSPACTGK